MVRGTVPMKDGMLSVAWAIEPPWASVSTQAKSLDSRTTVENEVRTSAAAASSTIEISRVHSTSSVIAFKVAMSVPSYSAVMPAVVMTLFHFTRSVAKKARA